MEKHINPKNHNELGRLTQKKRIFECVICEMIFPKLWIYKNHKKQYHTDQIDIKSEPKENLHENAKKPFSCKRFTYSKKAFFFSSLARIFFKFLCIRN